MRINRTCREMGIESVGYPLLAKLTAHGETREAARLRARAALDGFPILGVRTNLALLGAVLDHPRFATGRIDTHFLEEEERTLGAGLTPRSHAVDLVAAAARVAGAHAPADPPSPARFDPWSKAGGTRV